ncbi:flagellar basal body P-ring formation chaperone FlgA [Hyphomicrobium sp. NDB2Meth4]|uniref:flagellar basal body P-ring formation chaperone FlgA n=1 Tax=Hyphomicrobium sp. NDB2Meth4 TaxID=1892846 RepID=UPI00093135E4|nr:flagellar basal body P-ring formation chaperone FlgA [Hyphomicrobium sp. NDB2Meth4]
MILSWFKSRSTQWVLAVVAIVGCASPLAAGQLQLPVPRVTIYPGQVIEQAMLVDRAFRTNDDASSTQLPSRDGLVGKVAKQTLLPGQPIYNDSIRAPHSVTQGQAASVIFQSGALTITASGIALQSGGPGDTVSVRNTDSGRIIKGTIGADGAVHVSDQ